MDLIRPGYSGKRIFVSDDGKFPNSLFPVIIYYDVLNLPILFGGPSVRAHFLNNGWFNSWSGGIYEYDHYHSNTWEAMAVLAGSATLRLGGPQGEPVVIGKGDVIIIPPGVAHRNLGKEKDVTCIGAYPDGLSFNMRYGKAGERHKQITRSFV